MKYHTGQSCKEYQVSNTHDVFLKFVILVDFLFKNNDKAFEKFVIGKKFKQCSKCMFWVEKNQGCDHMTCRCGYQFCYKCGGEYLKCECVESKEFHKNSKYFFPSEQRLDMERRRNMNMKRKLRGRKK